MGIEHGLDRRFGQSQLVPELIDRKVLVQQQIRRGSMGVQQQRPPRAGTGRQPAGQRSAALRSDVTGRDLVLAGQRGEHLGVRGQQHGFERHRQVLGQPARRCHDVVRDRRLVFADARHRIEGPPRYCGESTGEEHSAPELPVGLHSLSHLVVPLRSPSPPSRSPRLGRRCYPFLVSASGR
jgi:hypothetical protein